ncbi:MAG: T9SS type A sorting domain-containing protein [Bacteroidetes bacterium]|nr:T9SS type A sorting domain-containing protein [Bacteroidota bacterium]
MKRLFVGVVMAVSAIPAIAQKANSFDVSVFEYSRLSGIANKQQVKATQTKLQSAFPGFMFSTDQLSGLANDIFGSSMQVQGATNAEKASYIMDGKMKDLGVSSSEWVKTNEYDAGFASYIHYIQSIYGHTVAFSRMSFRFTPDGAIQRIMMNIYGRPQQGVTPAISSTAVLTTKGMTTDLDGVNISNKSVDNNWVWFPVPTNTGYQLHPAWAFTVTGTDKSNENLPVELTGYIDANTGDVLYRTNAVKETINRAVKASVYKNGLTNPASLEGLPYIQHKIGTTIINANDTGFFTNSSLSPTKVDTVKLMGTWSTVRNLTGTGAIPTFIDTIVANGSTYVFPLTSPSSESHVNAYYHTTRMHDFVKARIPSTITGIDVALNTIVDVVDANGCNAFYGGNAINFYAENSSCNEFAKIGDVVYHEYGHFVTDKIYTKIKGSGMSNGGLNEACSDVWAMSVTDDPVLGKGAFKSGGNIRTYNSTPKIFPKDVTGEVHANGEMIAGSWWDVRVNIGNLDTMTRLFVKTYNDVPDGPNGTETDVFHKVLVSALINDDDDANLANGTPHFVQITQAFGRHGIFLFGLAAIDHKDMDPQPIGTPITVKANVTTSSAHKDDLYFQSMKMVYRNHYASTTWDTVSMTNAGPGATSGTDFTAQIPAQPLAAIVDYYFITYDIAGNPAYTFPNEFNTYLDANQVTIPYQFAVGVYKVKGFDFENDEYNDWQIGTATTDNATSGKWIRATPIASYWKPNGSSLSFISQTGNDHTTGGGQCLVTGNATSTSADYNTADVDNGTTTIITPPLDLGNYMYPVIEYYRWYSDDRGGRDSDPRTDSWRVQIKDPNAFIWKTIDQTYQSDYSWRRRMFALLEELPNTKIIQMKFIAEDLGTATQNNVEAAVDDIFIYDIFPTGVNNPQVANKFNIFPNPANNSLNISLSNPVDGTMSLYDMTGKQVASQNMSATVTAYTFNTSGLASGQYMIMVQTANSIQTHKIAIKH